MPASAGFLISPAMNKSPAPSVYFIGLGALGILYAKAIENALGKHSVTFAADKKRCERYRQEEIYLNDQRCFFNFVTPDESSVPADFLFFSVKGTALDDAIKTAAPLVNENTVIISLLNGISSEEILKKAFPQANVLYCIGQKMDALKQGSKVIYRDLGELCIGIPKNNQNPKLEAALRRTEGFFDSISLPYVSEEDIIHRMWCKWMLNVGVNQAVMINEGKFRTVHQEGAPRETMKAAMREVLALSQKNGVCLTEDEYLQYLGIIDKLNPEGMPSMRQDGVNKRRSEVEMFAGTVVALGKELGVPTPVNEKILQEVREMESNY